MPLKKLYETDPLSYLIVYWGQHVWFMTGLYTYFPLLKLKNVVNVSYVSHMYQSRLVQGHKINYGKNLIDNIKTYRCSYSLELSNLATLAQQGQSPAFPLLNLYVHTPSLFTSVTLLASPAILPGLNPPPILNTTKAIRENCSGCGDPDVCHSLGYPHLRVPCALGPRSPKLTRSFQGLLDLG